MPTRMDPELSVETEPMRKHNILWDNTQSIDAAKVPPSVFAAQKGEPEVRHKHPNDFADRHGIVESDQGQLSGV